MPVENESEIKVNHIWVSDGKIPNHQRCDHLLNIVTINPVTPSLSFIEEDRLKLIQANTLY